MREAIKQKILKETPVQRTERMTKAFSKYQTDFNLSDTQLKSSLLDIGVNDGGFISYVREVLHNTDAYGIEHNDSKVIGDGFVVADGNSLPFSNSKFDTILARNYVPQFLRRGEAQNSVAEMLRVLRPGGVLMFNLMVEDGLPDEEMVAAGGRDDSAERHAGYIALQEFLKGLENDGYAITTQVQAGKHRRSVVSIRKLASE